MEDSSSDLEDREREGPEGRREMQVDAVRGTESITDEEEKEAKEAGNKKRCGYRNMCKMPRW